MSVDFNNPFDPYYDQFSIHEADFTLPSHFQSYTPDNLADYQCVSVIGPNPSSGATSWTLNSIPELLGPEQWITIGIYRDEGRPATLRPTSTGLSWTRSGYTVIVTDLKGHRLHTGDLVNLFNVNVPIMTSIPVTVIDAYNFSVKGLVTGATSGSVASYQDDFLTDFYGNYRVFRLLPSFKLIPYLTVLQIFAETAPVPQTSRKTMFNITTNTEQNVPATTSSDVYYVSPSITLPPDERLLLARRFGQVYDSAGNPLPINYRPDGQPVQVSNVDSIYKNEQIFYNIPADPLGDARVFVYDYYGLDLNDSSRSPTYSSSNITRNLTVSGDINNFTISGSINYTSTLNDLFGNLAIGVQSNNALVIRKQILPLELDAFNRPVKNPTP